MSKDEQLLIIFCLVSCLPALYFLAQVLILSVKQRRDPSLDLKDRIDRSIIRLVFCVTAIAICAIFLLDQPDWMKRNKSAEEQAKATTSQALYNQSPI